MHLARFGGTPAWAGGWPKWPQSTEATRTALLSVLGSTRWAISGPSGGTPFYEQLFANQFAAYCKVKHCIPTSNGSSALLIALEALDIGPGDEVIVPALTWVASASAVTNVGAIPILVDIDPRTFCIDPHAIEHAISPRTVAIIPVHINGCMADMDAIMSIAKRHSLAIIEDAAHAHGARWRDKPAGSLGDIGAFSMQRGKLLTSGEGGASITNSDYLARRLHQLRADGRIPDLSRAGATAFELVEVGEVQGTNFCLSEFQSAVLQANLHILDEQHQQRLENAQYLETLLARLPGVRAVIPDERVNKRAFYCYAIQIDPEYFEGQTSGAISEALSAELGCEIWTTYEPLYRCKLYRPLTKKRLLLNDAQRQLLDTSRVYCPVAERAYETCLEFHHSLFLGVTEHMQAIADALTKVQQYASELVSVP